MTLPSSGTWVIRIFFHTRLCIFCLHDSFYPEHATLQFLDCGHYVKKETTITKFQKKIPIIFCWLECQSVKVDLRSVPAHPELVKLGLHEMTAKCGPKNVPHTKSSCIYRFVRHMRLLGDDFLISWAHRQTCGFSHLRICTIHPNAKWPELELTWSVNITSKDEDWEWQGGHKTCVMTYPKTPISMTLILTQELKLEFCACSPS